MAFQWAKSFSGGMKSPGYLLTPVEYSGIIRPHGYIQALATSVPPLTERRRTRLAPTGDERNLAMQLARTLFVRASVANSLLEKMKVENLTRTIVTPATSPSIIGSFSLAAADFETSGIVHNLFFIASVKSGELEPELVWTNLAQREASVESQQLVDQADLLGAGEEEIVTEIFYYENWRYFIYRRGKDGLHWDKSSRHVSAAASDSAELPAIKSFAPKSTAQRLGVHNSLR